MKYFYVICFLGFTPTLFSQSLDDYISEAMLVHPALKAARAAYEAKVAQTRLRRAWQEPHLTLGYAPRPIQTRTGPQNGYMAIHKPIQWAGLKKANIAQSQWIAQSHYHQQFVEEQQLRLNIKVAYYDLFEAHAQKRIQQRHLSLLKAYQELLAGVVVSESAKLLDVLLLDNQHKQVEIEHKLMEEKIQVLAKNFNRLLYRSESDVVYVVDSLELADSIGSPHVLRFNHPSMRALDAAAVAAHWAATAAKKQSYPKLKWGIQHNLIGTTDIPTPLPSGQNTWALQLSLQIPTAIKGYTAVRTGAQAEQRQWLFRRNNLKNQLLSQYEEALYQEKRAREAMKLHDYQIHNLEEILSVLQAGYRGGAYGLDHILKQTEALLIHKKAWVSSLVQGLKAQAKQEYIYLPHK